MRALTGLVAALGLLAGGNAGAVAIAGLERHGAEQACLRTVLGLHNGSVERVSSRIVRDEWQVRIDLARRDGSEWVFICTGNEGKLVRSVRVDED